MKKDPTQNFTKGRDGHSIEAIVIHITDGSFRGSLEWIKNPQSQASYHFLIPEDGKIIQLVEIDDTAWHAGKVVKPTWSGIKLGVNPNSYTLGIALVGTPNTVFSPNQFLGLCALVAWLSERVGIVINPQTIVFHREIRADKICPGYKIDKGLVVAVARIMKATQIYKTWISEE